MATYYPATESQMLLEAFTEENLGSCSVFSTSKDGAQSFFGITIFKDRENTKQDYQRWSHGCLFNSFGSDLVNNNVLGNPLLQSPQLMSR